MDRTRRWIIRAAAVAAATGALSLGFGSGSASARPDPTGGGYPADRHDCNSGFVYDPEHFDDGPVTDLFHHNVEGLLAPLRNLSLGTLSLDPHYTISCYWLYNLGL